MSKFIKIYGVVLNKDYIVSVSESDNGNTLDIIMSRGDTIVVHSDTMWCGGIAIAAGYDIQEFKDWLYRALQDEPHTPDEFPPKKPRGYIVSSTNPPTKTPVY